MSVHINAGRQILGLLCATVSLGALVVATAASAQEVPAAGAATAAPDAEVTAVAAESDSSAQATAADAPAGDAEPAEDGEIVVTGSRIVRNGADQPTPVAIVTSAELTAAAPTVIQGLNNLPQFQASTTSAANSNFGVVGFLNLRGLGPNRTLVLLDGRRLTPATTGTSPDVNTLPQTLVQRVDVVTGGASAAYGSDAVAGVVNFILDTKFTGLKGAAQYGISGQGDNDTYNASLTGGTSFLDGRAHIVATAEYYKNKGVLNHRARDWASQLYLPIPNPAVTAANPASPTNPTILIVPNARVSNQQVGGLITSGPLAGTQFLAGGVPAPFTYGTLRSAQYMQGGDGPNPGLENLLSFPSERKTGFVHASFDLSDNVSGFVEGMFADNISSGFNIPGSQAFTIFSGNAFLPASIQAQMTSLGLASIPLGRLDLDWGLSVTVDTIKSQDYSAGLDGKMDLFGRDFTWNAHYQHGQVKYARHVPNDPINANVFNAVDSVVVTPANVGTSGLTLGSTVCRTTLVRPTNGCVPYNPFGPAPLTAVQEAYLTDDAFLKQNTKQDAAAISFSGSAFDNWAGEVSIAAGAEWRKVRTVVTTDQFSQTLPATYIAETAPGLRGFPANLNTAALGVYQFGNYQPVRGSYNVKEFFLETVVPLAVDTSFADNLELNAAVRYTDYSTSGGVWTWKGGLVYEPTESLRFRATRSRDIRAPNINELFSAGRLSPQTLRDPANGNAVVGPVNTYTAPNLSLVPEKADTTTIGLVYQPDWLSGFTASIDAYSIKIGGAITAPRPQEVLDECAAGNTLYCQYITRQGGTATGALLQVLNPNVNLQTLKERGLDFEASYTSELGAGKITLRGFANYTDELSFLGLGNAPAIDRAGDVGQVGSTPKGGVPKWTGKLAATYEQGPFSFFIQERIVGGGKFDTTYNTTKYAQPGVPAIYINDNTVKGRAYTDITVRYNLEAGDGDFEFYATVNNLFDKDPPIIPFLSSLPLQTNGALYDVIGRMFTVGAKFKY